MLDRYPADDGSAYEGAVGIGAHTDWGVLTLLAQVCAAPSERTCPSSELRGAPKGLPSACFPTQDDVGGLEVCAADGAWLRADRAAPDTLLVNVGDMLQVYCRL